MTTYKHRTPAGVQLGNPFKLVGKLRPRSLMSAVRGQRQRLQRLIWKLEDASVFTAKFAVKAVVKGARPALVCEYEGFGGVGGF
jgi:hypothetical protein